VTKSFLRWFASATLRFAFQLLDFSLE